MHLKVNILLMATCCIDVSTGFLTQSCPIQPCDCSDSQVNCASRGLSRIPSYNNNTFFNFNPRTSIHMNFVQNNIRHLSANSFSTWRTGGGAVEIYLQGNQLATIDDDAFEGLETSITYLLLSRNNLTYFPDAISALVNLRYLFLDDNPITHFTVGGLRSIGQSLVVLKCSYNNFQQWPKQLKYLTKLIDLDMKADVAVNTSTPLMPNDAFQGLGNNLCSITITGATNPVPICFLVSVTGVYIKFLIVNAPFPNCLSRLQHVSELSLSRGMSNFPDLTMFPVLKYLTLIDNPTLFYIPDERIPVNCSIMRMTLNMNGFKTIPQAIQKCVQLQILDISYNRISLFEHNSIENLPHLERLDLSSNPLQYFSSLAFENLPALRNIVLRNTTLTSLSPLAKIVTLTSITPPNNLVCSCAELGWLEKPAHRNITIHGFSYCSNRGNETLQHYIATSLPLCQ